MPKKKRLTYPELLRILMKHDSRFEVFEKRAKGSHRMIYHPDIGGKPASFPVTYHKGQTIGVGMIAALRRRFGLPDSLI